MTAQRSSKPLKSMSDNVSGTILDLVASAVILHNAVDLSLTIQQLSAEGVRIDRQMLASLSPYLTRHLKRYGNFVIDLQTIPMPLEGAIFIPLSDNQT